MIGASDPRVWTAVVIALALAVSVARLMLWRRTAELAGRGPMRRLASLIVLQLAAGVLLHLTLFPPAGVLRHGVLMVATEGAPAEIVVAPGDVLVALPEAGAVRDAVPVPDLATALRRYPQAARIRVEGQGLAARDRGDLPVPVDFDPPPPPPGLIDLTPPGWAAPGAPISVGGQVGALTAGVVELVDPAGRIVDRRRVAAGQRFVLTSTTRAAGLALFSLRLRDAAGMLVEQVAVPVETRAQAQPRVRLLAGAPSAETKFLRRWAEDAGIDLGIEIDLGGGVRLGDAVGPLTRQTLGEIDLLVIDDRRWETLDAGARAALTTAVDDGLGLLLRPTGPLSGATRRDWAQLGLSLSGGETAMPLRLGSATTDVDARDAATPDTELARRDIGHEGPGAVSLLRDADGVALASWRSRGTGRVGVWTVTDSYALVLTGQSDRYGEVWSALFSALARPGEDRPVQIDPFPQVGQRVAICQLIGQASVVGPERAPRALRVDPATGERNCAAYWPERSGWHVVRDSAGRETPFHVHAAEAGASLRAFANREATLTLAAVGAHDRARAVASRAPGNPWPWFAALLIVAALLWWLERIPRGRAGREP